ncbi:Wzz/FepE/Etk N-terminal domain-containing protein [Mucilaginibacter sp. L196]|uniref:exopolysaccharide transport family protein n=1 Tax=Mucilaginibacter sp. L196 TaxID=1641870 RepID=UPI00131A7283|nr:Wzz/FepE/Etk N-terminal domain-containing protein [Mucilaginibacter sp. L196]
MELGDFFKVLSRHKLTLIIVPIIAIIITYFLVRNQPSVYTSQTQIATGLVDKTQVTLGDNTTAAESQVAQDFDNLIEILRSKRITEQVSYQLMIHDLTSQTPFRPPSKLLLQLNQSAREHALAVYTDYYNRRKELSLFNPDQNGLHSLLLSMKYDDESLLKNLNIYRAQSSDFIDIEYNDDDPQLTAFVVNTLAHEFTSYYSFIVKDNQHKAVTFLGKLVDAKRDTLDSKIGQLKNYKIQNRILSIPEQSRALYSQLADYETHLEQAQRDAISTQGAINSIDNQFKPGQRKYLESLLQPVNQSLVSTTDQLKILNERYIESNFDTIYKVQIDSLQRIISERINQSSDKYIVSPLATQQNLVQERLTLQVQYELAKNSIGSIQQALNRLNAQLDAVVPHEAIVQQDESAIDVAQKEYLDILNKYNQTSLDASYSGDQLKQLDTAMPGIISPSKKMLLVILSGIISFIACVVIFFILYFIDDTVKTPEELANRTVAPVLGYLNLLSTSTIDLRQVWSDPHPNLETYQFRNLLQSVRFEVDTELGPNKVLLVNSLANGEGKTFLATNLAYAYSLVNKKVLLIDGNFHHPGITHSVKSKLYIEDYFKGTLPDFNEYNLSKITVFSNKGGDGSLLEVNDEKTIREKFEKLKSVFDIIIIEASSLNTLNKSKEWNKFTDKILTIFEAGKRLRDNEMKHINYLKSLNGKFMGWVLNVVNKLDAADEDHTNAA